MASQGQVVQVTAVVSTEHFYCQVFPNARLDTLMGTLREAAPSLPSVVCKVGDTCCAQYSEDNEWYRARVLEVNGQGALVLYLDYGNSENVLMSSLKSLPPKLTKLAPQAKLCALSLGDESLEDEWPQSVQHAFSDFVVTEENEVRMLELDQAGLDGVTPVQMWVNGCDVATELRAVGASPKPAVLSIPPSALHAGEKISVMVSRIESVKSFWCQLWGAQSRFEELEGNLTALYQKPDDIRLLQSTELQAGTLCCVNSDDYSWCRAQVERLLAGDMVEVTLVDFGCLQVVPQNACWELCAAVAGIPAQGFHAQFSGASNDPGQTAAFKALVDGNDKLQAEIVAVPGGTEQACVILYDNNGISLLQHLPSHSSLAESSKEEQKKLVPQRLPTLDVEENQVYEVIVVLTDPTHSNLIYCQLVKNAEEFAGLQSTLAKASAPALGDFAPGQLCIGQSSHDSEWYRAMVEAETDGECQVLFVDFGDRETIQAECLRELPAEFLPFPAQAISCWVHPMSSVKVEDLAGCDDSVIFKATFTRGSESHYDVKLSNIGSETQAASQSPQPAVEPSPSRNGSVHLNGDCNTSKPPAFTSPEPATQAAPPSPQPTVEPVSPPAAKSRPAHLNGDSGISEPQTPTGPTSSKSATRPATTPTLVKAGIPLYPKWPLGSVQDVVVSRVESADRFWLQADVHTKGLGRLTDSMRKDGQTRAETAEAGQHYIVRNPAGRYFRGECSSVSDAKVQLYLYDYGQTISTSITSVYQWNPFYGSALPRVAVQCRLSPTIRPAAGFPMEIVDRIKALAKKEDVQVKIVDGETTGVCEVVFFRRGVSLDEQLLTGVEVDLPPPVQLPAAAPRRPPFAHPPHSAQAPRANVPKRQSPPLNESSLNNRENRHMFPSGSVPNSQSQPSPTTPQPAGNRVVNGLSPVALSPSQQSAQTQPTSDCQQPVPCSVAKTTLPSIKPPTLTSGTVVNAIVQDLVDSRTFWCQLTEFAAELDALQEKLATAFESVPTSSISNWPVNSSCATVFSEDGAVYRGVVEKQVSTGRVLVRFADFGNCEEHDASDLYALTAELADDLPMQAVKCTLSPGSSTEMILEQEVSLKICSLSAGVAVVEPQASGSAAAESETMPCPFPPLTIKASDVHSVRFAYHDKESNLVWCQLAENDQQMEAIISLVASLPEDSFLSVESAAVGTACCALSSDGAWYRAVIEAIDGPAATVCYVDYGNSETVETLGMLNDELKAIPKQAVACRMADPSPLLNAFEKCLSLSFASEVDSAWIVELSSGNTATTASEANSLQGK